MNVLFAVYDQAFVFGRQFAPRLFGTELSAAVESPPEHGFPVFVQKLSHIFMDNKLLFLLYSIRLIVVYSIFI